MKKNLLDILACPGCGHDLALNDEVLDGEEIMSGSLACGGCHARFEIKEGVPCMLFDSSIVCSTQKGFSEQWKLKQSGKFKIKYQYGVDYDKWIGYMADKGVIDCQDNDWVLDAGCGSGALTYAFARRNENIQVVGMDFQNDIYRSARDAKDNPHIHFVHGDVMHPPFKKRSIKLLMSHGVLHHTENTKRAFDSVSDLVAKEGKMSIWLYPHSSECGLMMKGLYVIRDFFFLGKGHLLPPKARFCLSQATAALQFPIFMVLGIVDMALLKKKLNVDDLKGKSFEDILPMADDLNVSEFYRMQAFVNYDNITPEYQFRHKKSEVMKWFESNRFVNCQADPYYPGYYHGVRQST